MDNNMITITDEDNNTYEVEVLDIFSVVGYEGKEYILYTMNTEVDENNIKAYVSILEQNSENEYSLVKIEDEKELRAVEEAIKEVGE